VTSACPASPPNRSTSLWPRFAIGCEIANLFARRKPSGGYLHEFTRHGGIFSAGRGWYSTLSKPFVLDREPVSSLVQQLNQTFPFLEYSCWSTEQIRTYGHHLLARFVTFVHTDRDAMSSVFEFLRNQGYDAHLNPRGQAARGFTVRERTIVVRPRVTT